MALQPDGKVVVAGTAVSDDGQSAYDFLARLTLEGVLDTGFGNGGIATIPSGISQVHSVLHQPDGTLVVAGSASGRFAVGRFTSDGAIDESFGTSGFVAIPQHWGWDGAWGVCRQPDGKLVVAGTLKTTPDPNSPSVLGILRVTSTGQPDPEFGGDGFVLGPFPNSRFEESYGTDVLCLSDRVIAGGSRYSPNPVGESAFLIAVDSHGELLPGFGQQGVATMPLPSPFSYPSAFSGVTDIHPIPNGGIVFGAHVSTFGMGGIEGDGAIAARLSASGGFDSQFSHDGIAILPPTHPSGVEVVPLDSGSVYVATASAFDAGIGRISRLMPNGELDTTFAVQGVATIDLPKHIAISSLIRRPNGNLLIAGGLSPENGGNGDSAFVAEVEASDPLLAPADRDGDGIADHQDACADVAGPPPVGCPPSPPPTTPSDDSSHRINFWALGDSVTAGFGYDDIGSPVSRKSMARACTIEPQSPDCQSPYKVSYPAFFAQNAQLPDYDWGNYAMSGSTPKDWLQGRYKHLLDDVVASNPDLTALTLGANPLLTDAITLGQLCARAPSVVLARLCIRADVLARKITPRLTAVLKRLLSAPDNHVVVFEYHDTVPLPLAAARASILVEELNRAVAQAVKQARKATGATDRIRLVSPGPFAKHRCFAKQPWVLRNDLCIHPNADGYKQFASGLMKAARSFGLLRQLAG